jgi:hypothetical protein
MIVGQIIHINMKNPGRQNLTLITNLVAGTQAEIDLHALEWRLPDSVDDANNTPGRELSSSLFEEASHETSSTRGPRKIKREWRKGTLSGKISTSFYYYASILAHMLLTSSYRIATRLVPRHIIRLRTIPTQQQSLPRNGYYQSLQYQPGLVLPIQYLQSQLRLTRHILLSTMSLAALSTTASKMPHNGTRWLVQPSIRLEMLLYGFTQCCSTHMGQWLDARSRSSEPSVSICPALGNPRRACHRRGAGRQRDAAPTLSRSHDVAKSNSDRFNRKISTQARLGRSENVSQILKKLKVYDNMRWEAFQPCQNIRQRPPPLICIASTIIYIPPTPHHQALVPTQQNNIP